MEGREIDFVKVRFPNECVFDKVKTFKLEDFKLENTFEKEVFGKWINIYVFVDIEDYKRLKDEQIDK
jgi:hypothetical protein